MLLAAEFKFVNLQHDFFAKFSEEMCDAGVPASPPLVSALLAPGLANRSQPSTALQPMGGAAARRPGISPPADAAPGAGPAAWSCAQHQSYVE